jgi:hypothetical protein
MVQSRQLLDGQAGRDPRVDERTRARNGKHEVPKQGATIPELLGRRQHYSL